MVRAPEHGSDPGTVIAKRIEGPALSAIERMTFGPGAELPYQILFERHPSPMWVFDRHTLAFLAVNDAAIREYGFSRDEFLAMSILDIRPAEDVPPLLERLSAPPPRISNWRHRRKDGTLFEAEVTSTHLMLDGRDASLVLARNVSATRSAQRALEQSERSFRALIEHAPHGVLVYREGGRIVYANPAMVRLLGYDSAGALVGRDALDVVHPDNREHIRLRMAMAVEKGSTPAREHRMLRRDGSTVYAETEALKLDFDGRESTVVLARDLTERREMLARLAVADRLASVGTLAAGVAHEINSPLLYVITNLGLVAEELPRLLAPGPSPSGPARLRVEDVMTLLRDARDGASRVRAVVRDLRTLSRADDEQRGPVDVRAALALSIKMAKSEIVHRARLVEDYEPVPMVWANESRLGQVFLNLLINAAQAISDGDVDRNEIRVRVRSSDDGSCVRVEIRDTGCGIPRELLNCIFDPFVTTKPVGIGTGLGLSICHRIVKALGGDISIESNQGQGTVARVVLNAAPSVPSEASSPAEEVDYRGSAGRVLVVDDEPAIGTTLRLLLAPEHEVVSVTRALQALAKIEAGEHFDAILCDMMMPDMNGMEFHARVARSAPELLSRIVFVTGGAFTAGARDFLARVPNRCLEKPFDTAELRAVLRRVAP
jgi:two-component system cell cycle sensor histidine kinase/response regulator CckA